MLEALVILLVFVLIFFRNGPMMIVPIAFTWIAAAAFDPPLSANAVWFIAAMCAYMFPWLVDDV